MPLQVLDSSPVSGNDEPHWLSRLSDHMETRPRWFAAAKPTRPCASATVKFSPWMSFWPIITVAPSRCQICCERSWMPYVRVQVGELPVGWRSGRRSAELPPCVLPGGRGAG